MAKYLVTGGAGFIGGHLTQSLAQAGHQIVVVDDLSTGSTANLAPGVVLIQADIRDHGRVARVAAGCDAIIHLAAIASVMRYGDDWQEASAVNLGGTISVMRAAAAAAIPVIYASSAAVYGAALDLPIAETTAPRPISGYGADKLACELHATAMADVDGLASVGLRFFNVYGPRQLRGSAYSGVITNFLDRWQNGEALQIFGDGTQSRDFIYVGDIVRAIIAAIALATQGGAHRFNICSGTPTTINDLVALLTDATGHAFETQNLPARSGEIVHSLGDGHQARALMGFEPSVSMDTGLTSLAEWFRSTPT